MSMVEVRIPNSATPRASRCSMFWSRRAVRFASTIR
jgi:hypothetical protein